MRRPALILVLTLMLFDGSPRPGWTQSPLPAFDKVEEDWVLVIREPDPTGLGPQITTTMRAQPGDDSAPFIVFNLNYRDHPAFVAGGLQVQAWYNNAVLTSATRESDLLRTLNEQITWTQRMEVHSGSLVYKIVSGESTTWGKFGEGNNLGVAYTTALNALPDYSPDDSVTQSGVGWQSNRVEEMTLVQVRYYQGTTLVATDTTPRSVSLMQ